MKPIVAIVGRPNVGKSTLFNKLLGRKKAIVVDEPGVTRDLNYADIEELGRPFTIIDTGGFEVETQDAILKQVRDQTRLAIEDADVIVFVMDGRVGLTSQDIELVEMLRRVKKPVIYAANKMDTIRLDAELADFYALGIEEIVPVSAEHGRGVNELIDKIIEHLPEWKIEEVEEDRIKIAIVGRPNVGKSSLLNRILGKPRAIVSNVAGTTRDPVDMPFEHDDRKYLFIDTAGIRKKNKVSLTVETYCVMEAIKSIERCDVAILVVDAQEGIKSQDEKIAGLIEDRGKCCIIIVNKWDAVEKDTHTIEYVNEMVRRRLPFIPFAPVLLTSALTGQRVPKVLETINEVVDKSRQRVSTSSLNKMIEEMTSRYGPPVYRGRAIKFYYATQTGVLPPTFVIFANFPEGVADNYKRYMINGLRELLGLDNVPIRVYYRKRE
ncbi:MAG: ribosome biogenesis GTPase Der [Deltaproteobacteria bacterium]|nr:ribosome biogenesis GTPase Der [Deltaproteobacteria bacterium]